MKKIGMVVACEIDAVLRKYGTPAEEFNDYGFNTRLYHCDGYDIYAMHTGVGEIAAAAGTQVLISVYKVDFILNFGVVGGLTKEMGIARSAVVTKIVHYDMDTSAIDHVEVGRYLEYPDVFIPTTKEMVEKAMEIAPELVPVVCASADKFVEGEEKKSALHKTYGADICEMESAGIALTCNRSKVPFLMIKTVSDSITGGADEFTKAVNETSDVALSIAEKVIQSL